LIYNEENTIQQMVLDTAQRQGWTYYSRESLQRQFSDVLVERSVRKALIQLNPSIAEKPERADEVIYRLRTIWLGSHSTGLVAANQEFEKWLKNDKSMPFGLNNAHVTIRLVDYDNYSNNEFTVTKEWTFIQAGIEKRFDIVYLINGIPVVIGEVKTPVRDAVSWYDGATQLHDDYEINVSQMFVPNVFSYATEGKEFRYGSVRMPIEMWGPWREDEGHALSDVRRTLKSLMRPEVILDILQSFTLFATDKKHRAIKIICRYQQYDGANKIVDRVVRGQDKKGLIWHFQGSGKSLLMVFVSNKLRRHEDLGNPTILVVVDRIELDSQITATFSAAGVENLKPVGSRAGLRKLLEQDTRKVLMTTIHKFGEVEGVLNDRDNIICLVDEAHRSQEGDLGVKMRGALPNAFLFGFTGTPINKRDRNTFFAFGSENDDEVYLSRYSFVDSIRDGATLRLHFEAVPVNLRVDRASMNEAFADLAEEHGLTDDEKRELAKRAAKTSALIKTDDRIGAVCAHIAEHFQTKVAPNGFKAQVVTYDRESCILYKQKLDEILGPEASTVVMHTQGSDPKEWRKYSRSRDEEEALLDRFRDESDPLQIVIVTARLLTGFDAPILQTMYLDKPIKDHNLLQAICRTNRPYPNKDHGLIVDYLGIFDDVAKALEFDEKSVTAIITNLTEMREKVPELVANALHFFSGVDRSKEGWEGLIEAQDALPDNATRDAFALSFQNLTKVWEALSPDPVLNPFRQDYRWLGQVYESLKPPSGSGKLLWRALGAKTMEIIHENIELLDVGEDFEKIVLDAALLEGMYPDDPPKRAKVLEIHLSDRLRKHSKNPVFVALGERFELLRIRHEQGVLSSIEFLKSLLVLARDVLVAEQIVEPEDEQKKAKAALTELFRDSRNDATPKIIEQIVDEIDSIVRNVRFDGWQATNAGKRDVQMELRKALFKFKMHIDQELFDRAYTYIERYY
jgi:type I restriction enzyme, R subunit